MPSYTFKKHIKIVVAIMDLNNYIRRHSQNYDHFIIVMDDPCHSVGEHIRNIVSHQESYDTDDGIAQDLIILKDIISTSLMEA